MQNLSVTARAGSGILEWVAMLGTKQCPNSRAPAHSCQRSRDFGSETGPVVQRLRFRHRVFWLWRCVQHSCERLRNARDAFIGQNRIFHDCIDDRLCQLRPNRGTHRAGSRFPCDRLALAHRSAKMEDGPLDPLCRCYITKCFKRGELE